MSHSLSDLLLRYAHQFEDQHAPQNMTIALREAAKELDRLYAGGCARDQGTTQYCAEAARLAAENERLRERMEIDARHPYDGIYCRDETIRLQDNRITELKAEVERLRAALENVMIGGNHLVSIIGIPHPAVGMTSDYVLAHYGPGHQYDAWCCWNAIMEARAALKEPRT